LTITRGGRDAERSITLDYLRLLDGLYEEWMRAFSPCPVLAIN